MQSAEELHCSLHEVAQIWRHGSLVESRLLDLIAALLSRGEDLSDIAGWVDDTGAGRWAIAEAIERGVSTPAMVTALEGRIRSRENEPYADRLLAALRAEFGGHSVKLRGSPPGESSYSSPGSALGPTASHPNG